MSSRVELCWFVIASLKSSKKSWLVEEWIRSKWAQLFFILIVVEGIETVITEEEWIFWKTFVVESDPFGGIHVTDAAPDVSPTIGAHDFRVIIGLRALHIWLK